MLKHYLLTALAVGTSGILLAIFASIGKDKAMQIVDPLNNIGLTEEEILVFRYLCTLEHMSTGEFPKESDRDSIRQYMRETAACYCPKCHRWYSVNVVRCVYCVLPESTTGVKTVLSDYQTFKNRVYTWEENRKKLIETSKVAYTRADIIRLIQVAAHQKERW